MNLREKKSLFVLFITLLVVGFGFADVIWFQDRCEHSIYSYNTRRMLLLKLMIWFGLSLSLYDDDDDELLYAWWWWKFKNQIYRMYAKCACAYSMEKDWDWIDVFVILFFLFMRFFFCLPKSERTEKVSMAVGRASSYFLYLHENLKYIQT